MSRSDPRIQGGFSAPLRRIDRSLPTPLYHQLEQIIRAEIEAGMYRPGDLLPSEKEIAARYDVSRSVIRQMLQNLAHAGVVRTQRGRGTSILERKLSGQFVQRATGFFDDVTRMGLDIRTRVLRQEIVEVPLEVRKFLGVSHATRIDRVRSVGGRVLVYVVTYIPSERAPGLELVPLTDRSLYSHLQQAYGLQVSSGSRTVEAVAADGEAARQLEVPHGSPLLLLRSKSLTQSGEPLEWFEAWHRADRTRFELQMLPPGLSLPHVPSGIPMVDGNGSATIVASSLTNRLDGVWATAFGERLRRDRVVAVLRAPRYGDGRLLAEALAAGGVGVVEYTLTGANALQAIEQARRSNTAVVGAGSVLDAASGRRVIDAGAQFIVCPAYVADVAELNSEVPVVLAGFTPSEVLEAHRVTQAPVKVFPASVGGPGYIKALSAPMPHIPLMPSGGVDRSNVANYLRAGAVAVSVGGPLCPPTAVEAGDGKELSRRATELMKLVRESVAEGSPGG